MDCIKFAYHFFVENQREFDRLLKWLDAAEQKAVDKFAEYQKTVVWLGGLSQAAEAWQKVLETQPETVEDCNVKDAGLIAIHYCRTVFTTI